MTSEDRTLTKPVDVKTDSADDSVERTSEDIDIEGVSEDDSTGATVEDDTRRCAACGNPIVPGQQRGPNADHKIVHKSCMDPNK